MILVNILNDEYFLVKMYSIMKMTHLPWEIELQNNHLMLNFCISAVFKVSVTILQRKSEIEMCEMQKKII